MPTLFLIDGHALAYRTYFALTQMGQQSSRWLTKNGEPTAGTYGFVAVLLNIMEKEHPEYLAVSFDLGRTFRDDLFADYKGTREKMPDDLAVQIGRIQEIVAAFNLPLLVAEGYEADDVLGTVARQAAAQGVDVIILTGDRDLLQLAAEHVTIRLAGQKLSEAQDFGPAEVQAKYGLTPQQYIDFKALVGDKSDNIPGVAGVGEKTATDLLQKYGSLTSIYDQLAALPAGARKKLETGRASADLSFKLSTIVTNVPLEFSLEKCAWGAFDRERLLTIFRELEFNSLLKRIPGEKQEAGESEQATVNSEQLSVISGQKAEGSGQMGFFGPPAPVLPRTPSITNPIVVTDEAALAALVAALATAPYIAFDTETTGTDPMQAELVGISLAVQEGEGYYIPVGLGARGQGLGASEEADSISHQQSTISNPLLLPRPLIPALPLAQIITALTPALTSPAIPKYGHNIKYDYIMLARQGVRVAPLAFDTMLAEWLCDPASHSLGLKKLAFVRLGLEMTEITELIGSGKKQVTFDTVPLEHAAAYAAADADVTGRLVAPIKAELEAKGQGKLLTDLELPLIPVLAEMEMAGITLDVPLLRGMASEIDAQLRRLEKEIYDLAGQPFNINSTQQLADVLFGKLQLRPPDKSRKTQAGKYSTAADVLEELRGQHAIIEKILEQRELAKLKSTYVDALPETVNPTTGRVHTSYKQTGAITGRLASEAPNLQNIPVRTELGRRVRKAFIAAPGQVLVAADYSQIELRLAAHLAQDETLLGAFRNGEDIHTTTAAAVLGVPPAEVTKDQRRLAKSVNFGLLYGQGAFGLSRVTGMTLAEAENFIAAYFQRFPGIKRYLEETKRLALERGYVETLLGRRRYFPGLSTGSGRDSAQARARVEREATNSPIQGLAADIIKIAMIRLPAALAAAGLHAKMLLQVHDELVLECAPAEVAATARILREVMENAYTLDIPLGVEVKQGGNWEEMQPIDSRL